MNSLIRVCQKCGIEIPADAPEGGCPGCLLETALDSAGGQMVFGRYKLVKVLGRGGMGIVWLARDEELERDVALKFLPDLMIQDRSLLDQLKRETKRCLELTHPHIVRIHDFVHDERSGCISMEDRSSQSRRLKRKVAHFVLQWCMNSTGSFQPVWLKRMKVWPRFCSSRNVISGADPLLRALRAAPLHERVRLGGDHVQRAEAEVDAAAHLAGSPVVSPTHQCRRPSMAKSGPGTRSRPARRFPPGEECLARRPPPILDQVRPHSTGSRHRGAT